MAFHRPRPFLLVLLAWWIALGLGATLLQAAELPPPPRQWVTDQARRLSPGARETLNSRLAAYERSTGRQVLVWIGQSTEGQPIDDWAVRTFESWKVGRKGQDDGLALFILAQDRKLRMEVGYGLEGQMPDALASKIIRETITPRLTAEDWDGAIQAGLDQVLGTLGGESADQRAQNRAVSKKKAADKPLGLPGKIGLALLGLFFLFILITNPSLAIGLLFSILSNGRGGGGGGGGGGWSGGGGRSGGGGASGSW